jgi:predicted HAD superfamily hydrolase
MQQPHAPLLEARNTIDSGKIRLLSLDIFDTTVWRSFPAPSDLFFALGARLIERGWLFPSTSAATFAVERMEAEQVARLRRISDREVTLQEIYHAFPPGLVRAGHTAADLVRAELELERESTFHDPEIAGLIDYAASRGIPAAFVSDTYFEEDHLRAILPREPHLIVNSCRYRKPKELGLHAEVLRRTGWKASQILHIGDNRRADFEAPRELGMAAVWRPRTPEDFRRAVDRELSGPPSERAAYFPGNGDAGLNAVRAQAVDTAENWTDPLRSWGALFLGPVIAGFGKWVIERSLAEGISTTLCLMREGRILKRVLDEFGTGIDTIEFFASRYALLRACIFRGEAGEIQSYLARPQPARARELCAPLGIDWLALGLDGDALISAENAAGLALKIAQDPLLKAQAVAASAEARRRLMAYFRKTVPAEATRIAVVDLGYSGTIQHCLQRILDHEKVPVKTHGLYLVTGSAVRKIQRAGTGAEGFLAENGQPLRIAHSFMRSPELVEQCLMCDVGSTTGYGAEGDPLLGEQHLPTRQLAEIARVQQGMLDFVRRFTSTRSIASVRAMALRPFLEAILVRSLTEPVPAELAAFGSWVHDENMGSTRTRALLAADIEPEYLEYASAHQLASLQSSSVYWIFGLAYRINPVIGDAVRSIFLRKARPESFQCPEDPRHMLFFWNDGAAHRADQSYLLSSRRTGWTRFALQFRDANLFELGFSFGEPGDFISVGAIFIRLIRPGEPVRVIRKSAAELGTFGLTTIPGFHGGFLVTEAPGVIARVEEIRNFTGVVQIDLLFTLAAKTGPGNGPLRSEVGDPKVAVEEEIVCQ